MAAGAAAAGPLPGALREVLAPPPGTAAPEGKDELSSVVDDPLFGMDDLFGLVNSLLYGAPISEREAFREHMLRTRMRLALGRARVASSPIQGLGVFATRRIAADELVTLYPGDALRFYPLTPEGIGPVRNGVLFGHHLPEGMRDAVAVLKDYRPYSYDVDGLYAVVGLPHLTSDPAYLGHMVNDATRCASRAPEELDRYRKDSAAKCNATFEGLLDAVVAVVASRPIAAGEEVLVAYGAEYWLTLDTAQEVQPHTEVSVVSGDAGGAGGGGDGRGAKRRHDGAA
mmetsp:Transcript_75648/g.245016  ORF Transcript_75648/g.245016 Transcript_75648/m.245016 type:complete len:285 (-) Transcript_75648:97-951(-)